MAHYHWDKFQINNNTSPKGRNDGRETLRIALQKLSDKKERDELKRECGEVWDEGERNG